jgi:Ras-related protein Rab-23
MHSAAGQEEFDAITRGYYRGAGAAVIAFSTVDEASFLAVEMWKSKIDTECGDISVCLVQNKVDLIDEAVVTPETVEGMARKLGIKLYRTCVKENVNVTDVFVYLAQIHNKKMQNGSLGQPVGGPAAPAVAAGSAGASRSGAAASSAEVGMAGEVKAGADVPAQKAMTVDLKPSKVRTGGKKKLSSKFSSCSVA